MRRPRFLCARRWVAKAAARKLLKDKDSTLHLDIWTGWCAQRAQQRWVLPQVGGDLLLPPPLPLKKLYHEIGTGAILPCAWNGTDGTAPGGLILGSFGQTVADSLYYGRNHWQFAGV